MSRKLNFVLRTHAKLRLETTEAYDLIGTCTEYTASPVARRNRFAVVNSKGRETPQHNKVWFETLKPSADVFYFVVEPRFRIGRNRTARRIMHKACAIVPSPLSSQKPAALWELRAIAAATVVITYGVSKSTSQAHRPMFVP